MLICTRIRTEALKLRSFARSLKVAAVVFSLGGTFVIGLYKGKTCICGTLLFTARMNNRRR